MIQIGLLVMAAGLLFGGVKPFIWAEKPESKTHPGVAILMIVLAVGLAVFALVFLPMI